MCKSLSSANANEMQGQPFRVESDTYHMLLTNYTDQYSCYTQNVENNVCVCPSGAVDYMCDTLTYQKCYINITEPPFWKDCADEKEDSFYYLYSVPGFSPCYPQDFNQPKEVEFNLTCKTIDEDGLVSVGRVDVGYPYRDVVKYADTNLASYVADTPETEFAEEDTMEITVQIDFRDMKYLSAKKPYTTTVDFDPEQGWALGSVIVNFEELRELDSQGDSRYIVGGRTYFEGSAFGASVNSFTAEM